MNMKMTAALAMIAALAGYAAIQPRLNKESNPGQGNKGEKVMVKKVQKTDKEWKKILTPEQYRVMRKRATERPFSGIYNDHFEKGVYYCAGCGTPLFASETKYDHGTGWPSFTAPADENNIEYSDDTSHLMQRTEVRCAVCGAHLGHVFDDGPAPTNKHYCINSLSLDFKPAEEQSEIQPGSAQKPRDKTETSPKTEKAIFAAGCFWGVEDKFRQIPGVLSTEVGYSGGHVKNPTYEKVCTDETGHAEAVRITFDPSRVSYEKLLEVFFNLHDPTQVNRQGPDTGTQYRSAIFYLNEEQKGAAEKMVNDLKSSGRFRKPIATQIAPASEFYRAEEYHQQYYEKRQKKRPKGTCGIDGCAI